MELLREFLFLDYSEDFDLDSDDGYLFEDVVSSSEVELDSDSDGDDDDIFDKDKSFDDGSLFVGFFFD